MRIPGWCRENETPGGLYSASAAKDRVTLRLNGKAASLGNLEDGFGRISRAWKAGDRIELNLPMAIRRMHAHPEVTADAGRVALQRGPLVYCVEAVDHGGQISHLSLPADVKLRAEHCADLLGGVTVIRGKVGESSVLAIPYYAWDNREAGEMAVWLKE